MGGTKAGLDYRSGSQLPKAREEAMAVKFPVENRREQGYNDDTGKPNGTDQETKQGEDRLYTTRDLKPQNLMDELASSGVKYSPDEVIAITKTVDGKLLWLEQGNDKSGLTHILERHVNDFASQGIDDIPVLLNDILQTAPINTGENAKGPFADYHFNGNTYRVAYGANGYIVSFFPID